MKTILVPTDFSDYATNALYYAAALASQTKSRLVLVHAIAMDVIELPGNPFDLKPDLRLEVYYLARLEQLASKVRVKHSTHLKVELLCVQGNILDHLNELVVQQEADLVVMGTKGANNKLQRLLGTNTARYIKQAVCPVLAIPVSAWYQGLKKIAYASDFDSQETIFLKQLFHFAKPLDAEVCIFNIKSENQLNLVGDNQVLQQIKRNFPDDRYSIAQLKENDVVSGIQAFIRENQTDMLALSVHKPDFLERLFHKSVSEKLVFQSSLPLLALPEKPYRHIQAGNNPSPAKTLNKVSPG
jgi:nucleotide-binding universal stress UspA family protein